VDGPARRERTAHAYPSRHWRQGRGAAGQYDREVSDEAIEKLGRKFAEVGIDYRPRIGEVKLQKWRDGWQNLTFLVRKRFGGV